MSIDLSENPSFQEQYERIKFLKEDFDKKEGWIRIMKGEKDCYWKKMFPESTIPLKVVFTFKLNMPAKAFSGMLSFEDVDFRKKWDKTFQDTEQLKKIEGVGNVIYVKAPLSFPFADRYFTLLGNDTHEVDWYGEKSYVNTVHNYKWDEPLPQAEGFVHASNGGNFYVVTPTVRRYTSSVAKDRSPLARVAIALFNFNSFYLEKKITS
ncbi:uncharacterized protein [Clytia hemisphaerica]|uniref:uncharacterized protein n=1 Tax=Clytia hemisphaerica TaxID=252671 RepID=UPI0034D45D58